MKTPSGGHHAAASQPEAHFFPLIEMSYGEDEIPSPGLVWFSASILYAVSAKAPVKRVVPS